VGVGAWTVIKLQRKLSRPMVGHIRMGWEHMGLKLQFSSNC